MSKGIIDTILDNILDDEWTGRYGEKLTERELKWVKLFGRKGKTLRNIYIPKNNGETSEIDLVFICQKGIYVFESKNYSGWIFGDEDSMNWTAMLPNKQKNRFYNPVKQNKTHIKWLRNYLGEDIPLFSIIVFSERCELKKIIVNSSDVKVIKRDRTYATVRDIWDENPDVLSEDKVNEIYDRLKELTNVDAAVKTEHINNINDKYKKTDVENKNDELDKKENISENNDMADNAFICPRCGSKLVLRTARKGQNAGNQFYGCSAFPKCRYIENVK